MDEYGKNGGISDGARRDAARLQDTANAGIAAAGEPAAFRAVSGGLRLGLKITAGLVLAVFVLCVLFLYALPTAIFEVLQETFEGASGSVSGVWENIRSYLDAQAEYFNEIRYSGEYGNSVTSILPALYRAREKAREDLDWQTVRSWFADRSGTAEGSGDAAAEEAFSPDNFYVVWDEESETNALNEKIEAVKDKFSQRTEELAELVTASAGEFSAVVELSVYPGDASADGGQYVRTRAAEEGAWEQGNDDTTIYEYSVYYLDYTAKTTPVYGGTSVTCTGTTISDSDAVLLLAAKTAEEGASVSDMALSDFMKWLGYNDGTNWARNFRSRLGLSDTSGTYPVELPGWGITLDVPRWVGTCLPQYLVTQKQYEDYFYGDSEGYDKDWYAEKYGVAAMDLFVTVDVPQPGTLTPATSSVYLGTEITAPSVDEVLASGGAVYGDSYTTDSALVFTVSRAPTEEEIARSLAWGKPEPELVVETVSWSKVQSSYELTYSYSLNARAGCRSTDRIAEILGISEYTGSGDSWLWPSYTTTITSSYGMRINPVTGAYTLHAGTDIGASYGTEIWAAKDGTVTTAGVYGGYGNCVILSHEDGYSTLYGHMSSIAVSAGDEVEQGQVIGYVGSTGNSTGPHLHFEIRDGAGDTYDPMDLEYEYKS